MVISAGSSEGAEARDSDEEWGDSLEGDPEEWLGGSVCGMEVDTSGEEVDTSGEEVDTF